MFYLNISILTVHASTLFELTILSVTILAKTIPGSSVEFFNELIHACQDSQVAAGNIPRENSACFRLGIRSDITVFLCCLCLLPDFSITHNQFFP